MDNRQPIFDFTRNLVVQAGAGTGKTYNLVRLYVHLLGGLTDRPQGGNIPLSPEQIACITFTDAAAAEMKRRIRGLVLALCTDSPDPDIVGDLIKTAEHLGRPMPDIEHWEQVRRRLPSAFVGTYHSFAARLLRENAIVAGLDPKFTLMTSTEEVEDLFEEVAREILLKEAKRGGRAWEAIYRYQLTQQGEFSKGLLEHLKHLHDRLQELGRAPESLLEEGHYSLEGVEAAFRSALTNYILSLNQLAGLGQDYGKGTLQKLKDLRAWLAEEGAQLDSLSIDHFASLQDSLRNPDQLLKGARLKDSKVYVEELRESLTAMEQAHHTLAFLPVAENIRHLLTEVTQAYAQRKAELGVLDFSDLLRRGRDLLRDNPEVRQRVKMQYNVILVDEFQDTNAIQRDLVYLLGESRSKAQDIDAATPLPRALTLERATLFVVGDWKQSIYGFRGADVEVFDGVREDIRKGVLAKEAPAPALTLRTNRRTVPPLIEATNLIFDDAMPGGHPFDGRFTRGEDDLNPFRSSLGPGPALRVMAFNGDGLQKDGLVALQAKAISRRILSAVREGAPMVWDSALEGPRPPKFGDFTLLFRSFSRLQLYIKELMLLTIPHQVVQGRGFYGAQEVRDLIHLLALIGDPQDGIPLLGVLRSPLVGLSDPSLAALALENAKGGLALQFLLNRYLPGGAPRPGALPKTISEDEQSRLLNFLTLYRRLARQSDRLGPEGLLQAALSHTAFDITLAGTFQGEQKVANIEKLLAQARAFEDGGDGGLMAFVRRMLRRLDQEPREAVAALAAEGGDACQLMTIHQSKGLEFPIVIIPEANTPPTSRLDAMAFDSRHGFGVRTPHPTPGESAIPTGPYELLKDEEKARALAESRRIFYVALTRARDHAWVVGKAFKPKKNGDAPGTWMGWVQSQAELLKTKGLLEEEEGEPLAALELAPYQPEDDTPGAALDGAAVLRAALPPPPDQIKVRRLVAPVTQLDDFQLCHRRYRFWHELNLEEFPSMRGNKREVSEEPAEYEGGALDPLRRGTLAHSLLEKVSLDGDEDDEAAAVSAMLVDQGYDLEDAQVQGVRDDVLGLLGSPFGGALKSTAPEAIHREWPFLLQIHASDELTLFVTGKMDLMIEEEGGRFRVVDYKHTHRQGRTSKDYHFQLMCYALAAQTLRGADDIQAEIVFLRDREHQWEGGPMALRPTPDELEAFRETLGEIGRAMVNARQADRYAPSPPSHCQDIHCGYLWRCHPGLRPPKRYES